MNSRVCGALVAATIFCVAGVPAADAAYPGANGKIVYEHKADQFAQKRIVFTVTAGDPASAKKLVKFRESAYNFVYSPNGKKIAFQAEVPDSQIFVMKASGKKPKSVTKKVNACNGERLPTWSPDGKKLAFQCIRAQGFLEEDLYTINVNGKGAKRITDMEDADQPAWSPLGDRIAFRSTGGAIYTVPAGGGESTILNEDPPGLSGVWRKIDWAPNGQTLVAEADGAGVHTIDANTGIASGLLAPAGGEPVFSPDGTRILYVGFAESPSSKLDLYAMDPSGANKQQITTGGYDRAPNWGPAP